jgi:hypothetical protein
MTLDSAVIAVVFSTAVLGLVCAGLVVDDFHQRDLATAANECRVELARASGRLEQFKDLLNASHPACGGMGPIAEKARK